MVLLALVLDGPSMLLISLGVFLIFIAERLQMILTLRMLNTVLNTHLILKVVINGLLLIIIMKEAFALWNYCQVLHLKLLLLWLLALLLLMLCSEPLIKKRDRDRN